MAFNWQKEYYRYRHYFINIGQFYQQKRVRVYTEIIFSILAITFFLFFAIKPTLIIVTGLIKTIDDQKTVSKKLEEKINSLSSAQRAFAEIQPELYLLEESLPPNASVSIFTKQLEALARKSQVKIGSLQMGQAIIKGEKDGGKTKELTFNMSVNGSFANLQSLLQSLSSLRRLIAVDSFFFKPSKTEADTLTLGINGKTFYLLEEENE